MRSGSLGVDVDRLAEQRGVDRVGRAARSVLPSSVVSKSCRLEEDRRRVVLSVVRARERHDVPGVLGRDARSMNTRSFSAPPTKPQLHALSCEIDRPWNVEASIVPSGVTAYIGSSTPARPTDALTDPVPRLAAIVRDDQAEGGSQEDHVGIVRREEDRVRLGKAPVRVSGGRPREERDSERANRARGRRKRRYAPEKRSSNDALRDPTG